MNDQYDKPVPNDLVLLDSAWLGVLSESELKAIDWLDWYTPRIGQNKFIFVSAAAVDKCVAGIVDFYGPETFYLEKAAWDKIDGPLHRWGLQDGFYHA